jgi:hypothetical protein
MSNLYIKYKEETIKELVIIYSKACILREYIHALPILGKIRLDNIAIDLIAKKISNQYHPSISDYIDYDNFLILSKNNVEFIFNNTSDIYNNIKNYKDIFIESFQVYDVEKSNKISSTDDRYSRNNIYIEKFFYIDNQNFSELSSDVFRNVFNLNEYNKIVNKNKFLDLLSIFLGNNSINVFEIFPVIKYGVRLVYNSKIAEQNKVSLYNNLSSKDISKLEKTNAILYENDNNEYYYFPVKLCEIKYDLYSLLGNRDVNSLYNLVNNFDGIFTLAIKTLWNNNDFKNLWNYHIPVSIIEPVLFENIVEKYKLLKDVYDKNLPYVNLNETIINIIDNIKNAEDPNKL